MSLVAHEPEPMSDEAAAKPKPVRKPTAKTGEIGAAKKSGDGARWSRTGVNFWLDALLLMLFVALATVSVIVRFIFPPGPQAAGWLLWGWTFSEWHDAQFTLLCVLAFGILVHVMLHWNWVCSVAAHRVSKWLGRPSQADEGTQTVLGVGLMIVILNIIGLVAAVAKLTIVAAQN